MQQLQQTVVLMQNQIDNLKHVQDQYEVSATVFINKSAELQSKLRAEGLGGTWTEVQLVDLSTAYTMVHDYIQHIIVMHKEVRTGIQKHGHTVDRID